MLGTAQICIYICMHVDLNICGIVGKPIKLSPMVVKRCDCRVISHFMSPLTVTPIVHSTAVSRCNYGE